MKLLEPINIGNIALKNRLVMAPMTRSRANTEGIISDMTTEYYVQRSSAGLIITEGVNISKQALGSPYTPGIFTNAQINAWTKVSKAVHEAGGKIFMQLWHSGRVAHSVDKAGELPVAPSAIAITGQKHFTSLGEMGYETPKALTTQEVKVIINDYKQAAFHAMEAGFDGVELHAAFGYLPNQFLVDGANIRNDEYGGSKENRCRFVLEIMNGLIEICGSEKCGIKLSPSSAYNNMIDIHPASLYSYLISKLNELPLAYLHLMQPYLPMLEEFEHWPTDVLTSFRHLFSKAIIINNGYDQNSAEEVIESGGADLVAFGALFLANPDLPKRFELNAKLNNPDRSTMYGGGQKGYVDYPFLEN